MSISASKGGSIPLFFFFFNFRLDSLKDDDLFLNARLNRGEESAPADETVGRSSRLVYVAINLRSLGTGIQPHNENPCWVFIYKSGRRNLS